MLGTVLGALDAKGSKPKSIFHGSLENLIVLMPLPRDGALQVPLETNPFLLSSGVAVVHQALAVYWFICLSSSNDEAQENEGCTPLFWQMHISNSK